MSDENNNLDTEGGDDGFGQTAEELTGFANEPTWFNRKRVKTILLVAGLIIAAAVITMTMVNESRAGAQTSNPQGFAATAPRDFLRYELERANRMQAENEGAAEEEVDPPVIDQWGFPAVVEIAPERPPVVQVQQYQQPPQPVERQSQPQLSPLVPRIEGSLFAARAEAQAPQGQAGYDAYQSAYQSYPPAATDYSSLFSSLASPGGAPTEAPQNNKTEFYSGASGGALSGYFLADDALWIGTIIPAVLVTAINTDLPGNVIARTTSNIFDSRTGRNLLIPQGTLLMAQYNSSVSYAQHRVQIIWDILIRPDGYQVELQGMNGVDEQGMAGIKAQYKENWFEYVKAAGIITLFSIANAKLTEEVAKRTSDEMAAAAVTANAEFVRDIGGNLISRAIDIQPTLTVSNGERISVMLNKNIFLPPVE